MLLVSRSLVITLFAWFPGEEDEDKGVSCLQPQGTCTSDDHDSPRDVQHPRLGGVPGPLRAHRWHHQPLSTAEPLGDHRGGTGGWQTGRQQGKGPEHPIFLRVQTTEALKYKPWCLKQT